MFIAGNFYGSLVVGDRDIYPSPADAMWLSFYVLVYGRSSCSCVWGRLSSRRAVARWGRRRDRGRRTGGCIRARPGPRRDRRQSVGCRDQPVVPDRGDPADHLRHRGREPPNDHAPPRGGCSRRGSVCSSSAMSCTSSLSRQARTSRVGCSMSRGRSEPCSSGWRRARGPSHGPQPSAVRQRFVVPSLFAASSIALLVYGQRDSCRPSPSWLAVAAVVAAAGAHGPDRARGQARWPRAGVRPAPTSRPGLANRRSFIERVEAALATAEPHRSDDPRPRRFQGDQRQPRPRRRRRSAPRRGGPTRQRLPAGGLARLGGDEFGALRRHPVASAAKRWRSPERPLATLDEPFAPGRRGGTGRREHRHRAVPRPRRPPDRTAALRRHRHVRSEADTDRIALSTTPTHDPNTLDRLAAPRRAPRRDRAPPTRTSLSADSRHGLRRVHGIEALVRWRRPDGSLTTPTRSSPRPSGQA